MHKERSGDIRPASPTPSTSEMLAASLRRGIEDERAALAREVHDDIGGALAAIGFDLAWIGRHSTDPAIQAHVDGATDMLQHAIGASRRIVQNLRPPVLDQGLVAAVQWLAGDFERRTGVKTDVSAPREIDVPDAVQLVAYRTAQEALTNAGKHAACSRVAIDLSGGANMLTIEIADNGRGIGPAATGNATAFGLEGMRERARSVNGWLDIGSRDGEGTSVTLTIPLPRSAADPSGDHA